jgi:hypothetical protein
MMFERTNAELGLDLQGASASDSADATHKIYFASADLPSDRAM